MSMSKFATMEDYYKHSAAELEKQNVELLYALVDLLHNGTTAPKSCGHDFTCVCPEDKARALIAKHGGGV